MPHAATEHIVHFYDRDDDLGRTIAEFVRDGLLADEHVLVLASTAHRRLAEQHLEQMPGVDLAAARTNGQLVFRDADHLFGEVVVDGAVDSDRFRSLLARDLEPASARCRVFGVVVSLLASRGMLDGALELEECGNELAMSGRAHVACAYDLRQLPSGPAAERIATCHHRTIVPHDAATPGPLVLLADDFEDARELYREYLTIKGYRVVTAADGIEAIEHARASRPAVILLDVRMPRLSGVDAMQELRRDPQLASVPIVALTAHAFHSEREAFLAKGFDMVVSKPCLPDVLVQTVENLLGSRPRSALLQ